MDSCRTLVHSTVTSQLDYCNSLLMGCTKALIQRLQRIQDMAARLVTRCPYMDDYTPVLRELHWLPVEARVDHKILTLVYKAQNDQAPVYLSKLIHEDVTDRDRRPHYRHRLSVLKPRTDTYGHSRFEVAGPVLWNGLPVSLRASNTLSSFRSGLKTHLFNKHL